MSEDVRRYRLLGQGRPDGHGLGHRTPHDVGCSEARQALVAGADEYRSRLVVRDSVLGQQGCQCSRQILRNGDDAVSAPFAAQQHLRVRPFQLKVVCVDAGSFGDPRAGPCQEQ